MRLKIRAAQTNKKLSTAEALLQLVTLERVSKTSPPLFKALRSKSRTSPQNAQHRRIFGDPGSCAPVFGREELLCFLCVYRGLKPASARLLHPTTRKNRAHVGDPAPQPSLTTFAPADRSSRALTQTYF